MSISPRYNVESKEPPDYREGLCGRIFAQQHFICCDVFYLDCTINSGENTLYELTTPVKKSLCDFHSCV